MKSELIEKAVELARMTAELQRTKKALLESEAKYKGLVDSIDQGFFLIDVIFDDNDQPIDLFYVESNAAAVRMLGRDLTGRRLREIDPDYEEYWYEMFGDVARTGKSLRMQRYVQPDNKWYDFYIFRLGGADDRRIGNIFVDITERMKAEGALQAELTDTRLLQSLSAELLHEDDIQALYDKIIYAATRIMRSDYASMQMLYPRDNSREELLLLAFHGFNPEAAKFWKWVGVDSAGSTCRAAWRTCQRVIVPDVERCDYMQETDDLAMFRQTGIRACQTTPLFSRSGTLLGMLSTHWRTPYQPSERELRLLDILARQAADLIERKRTEEELQRANDELEQRVRERTAELALTITSLHMEYAERMEAIEELREKDRLLIQQSRLAAMGEMINNIAHQWRQPLNIVGMHLQRLVLFYDMGNFDRDFLQESTEAAMKLVQHMSQTIDDFRNFFRPNKEKTVFAVNDAIQTTVALVKDGFVSNHIRIVTEMHDAGQVNGYFNEFCQALLNIVQNARDVLIERTVEKGRVTITSALEEESTVITITDNAGGISEEIMAHIFEPYFSTKRGQGTGIGLYMAKSIIETNMGGRISAFNTGQGAAFQIEL